MTHSTASCTQPQRNRHAIVAYRARTCVRREAGSKAMMRVDSSVRDSENKVPTVSVQ